MKHYLYILYFRNGNFLKVGVSNKSLERVKVLCRVYDLDLEKSLIFQTTKRIATSLERSLLSITEPLKENPFFGMDGCSEIREIKYLEYFLEVLNLHVKMHSIKVDKINQFITTHKGEDLISDVERLKKIINWKELSQFLANNDSSVSSNRCPKKYTHDVNELFLHISEWSKKC